MCLYARRVDMDSVYLSILETNTTIHTTKNEDRSVLPVLEEDTKLAIELAKGEDCHSFRH